MSSKSTISAGIANNALVVSFLSADTPRIWRGDLTQLLSAALEVQESQGKFALVMKRTGAPTEEIGTFPNKKSAVEALQTITDALLQGQGQGQSCATGSTKKSCGWFKCLLKFLLWIVGIVVALSVLGHVLKNHAPSQTGSTTTTTPAVQTGVPTPADSVLGK